MTNQEKRDLRILAKEGLTFTEIRKIVDCSDGTIRKYIKDFKHYVVRKKNDNQRRTASYSTKYSDVTELSTFIREEFGGEVIENGIEVTMAEAIIKHLNEEEKYEK